MQILYCNPKSLNPNFRSLLHMKLILALALGALSAAAHADVVTYKFSGTFGAPHLEGSSAPSTDSLLSSLVKQGDHFSGQFSFDTDAPAVEQLGGRSFFTDYYQMKDFQFKASDALNNAVPAWTGPTETQYSVINGPGLAVISTSDIGAHPPNEPLNYTYWFVVHASAPGGVGESDWSFSLSGMPSTTHFSGGRIPVGFNDIVDSGFSLRHRDNQTGQWNMVNGALQIEYVNPNVSPVPEPSSALMLLAGLAGVGGIARLRRRA